MRVKYIFFVFIIFLSQWSYAEFKIKQEQSSKHISKVCDLEWADEFDSGSKELNLDNWYFRIGGNDVNKELQYYTSQLNNARVENGSLLIESHREKVEGYDFTSARIISKRSFLYGRIEVSARLPKGRGSWPAIWMLSEDRLVNAAPWPLSGEIDIMEHVGFDPNKIHLSIHTQDYNWVKRTQKTTTVNVPNVDNIFHTYALEWRKESLQFFIDGEMVFEYLKPAKPTVNNWPFDKKFRLILNNAIGGFWGGEKGVDLESFPQRMEVDYVRVYKICSDTN